MATIRKYEGKSGISWQVRVRKKGKLLNGSFPSRKLAQEWALKMEHDILEQAHFPDRLTPQNHTTGDLIDLYVTRMLPQKAEGTQPIQLSMLKWWKDVLGDTHVNNVTVAMIEDFKYLLLNKPLAPGTVNHYLNVLSPVFTWAASPSLGWINRSPFNHIKRLKEGTRLPRLSDAELDHLLSWCEQFGQPHLYLFVRLALGTGGRYKEILRLRWTQINFKRQTITFLNTKNKEDRTVPVDSSTLALLKKRYEAVFNEETWGLKLPEHTPVFENPKTGKQLTTLQRPWQNARKMALVSWLHIHDLRHLYASRMAEKANADLGTLAQLLGHKTLKITMRYRHLTDQQYAPLVEKMAEAIFKNQHTSPRALEPSLAG